MEIKINGIFFDEDISPHCLYIDYECMGETCIEWVNVLPTENFELEEIDTEMDAHVEDFLNLSYDDRESIEQQLKDYLKNVDEDDREIILQPFRKYWINLNKKESKEWGTHV